MVFFLGSDQWLPHHIKRFEITLGSEIEYDRNLSILYFPLFRVHRNILAFFFFLVGYTQLLFVISNSRPSIAFLASTFFSCYLQTLRFML